MNTLSSRYRWATAAAAAAAMVGLVLGLTARSSDGQTQPSQSQASPATPVSVAAVEERNIAIWDEFSGRLEAVERVEIRSRVAGAVLKAHFREGALVKQGDLLITIDPDPYAAEVERTKAQVLAAEARVALTRKEQERAEQLVGSSAVSQSVLDQRVGAYREAVGNLRAAQAALRSAQLNLDYTAVRAPVAGRVGKLEVTVGNLVTAGPEAPVLTRLVSVNPIYASFSADEEVVLRALKALAAGPSAHNDVERIPVEMATVTSNGAPYRGHLQLIDNQVDARSGTVRVRAVFDNDGGGLMPGQFARLRMGQGKNEPALLINERAIGTDQSKKFVMVVNAENKVEYREVTLGASVDDLRVVTNGLKPGERIVVNGLQRVHPGALVAPEMVAMEAKSGTPTRSASGATEVIQR
jgi:membrane fusion protein, multidrug efflux system